MSSTTSRSAGEATTTPPVFSYAQAAKGRTTANTSSGVTSNQATSGVSTPAKGPNSMTNTPSVGSERGDQSVNGSIDIPNKVEQPVEANSKLKGSASTRSDSRPGSPSFGTASTLTLPKEEKDDFILVGGPTTESSRERSSHSGGTEKGVENTEGKRSKKGKKQKNAEKEALEKEKAAEEAKLQEQLVPAPLPAVNFWLQRKEEAAKTKPSPAPALNTQPSAESTIAADPPRSPETKRRGGKSNLTEDSEKSGGANHNGMIKDSPNSVKMQKKANETSSKSKEDQPSKRAGPRGGRVSEKEEKSPTTQLPPPVEDAMSWPTPETALEEEKRKVHEKPEKEEKDDSSSNKPRPKEKWQTLPYVPSVAFNTPLPSRGGRGRGGARGGTRAEGGRTAHVNATSTAGDKTQNASTTTASGADADKRVSRGDAPRAASLPPNQNKRPSSDPSSARDQRKPAPLEKPRGAMTRGEPSDIRNTSFGEEISETSADQNSMRSDARNLKQDQSASHDAHAHSKSNTERRSEPNIRTGYEQSTPRAEGRPDRGRGGFRGRGNHNYQNGQHPPHVFTNGHNSQHPNGYPGRQGSGPYSPPLQGAPYGNHFPVSSSRGGRGGNSRSQSIPNSAMYPRFPNGGPGQHIPPPLQTSNMYDYTQPMQSMSAAPFNPYIDHASVLAMVKMQLEYYFSIDNLCKDVFLRKHMDSQGFVFLNFIASFKRIQALTQDFDLLYYACHESEIIEQIKGEDGVDRMRRKDGWEKWVLPVEERDESARNAGPSTHWRPPPHHIRGQMIMSGNHSMSPPPFSPNGTEASFRPYGNGAPATPSMNGNGNIYHPETPLSAAVPDFAPGLLVVNGSGDPLETFTDEEVANLTLVFAPPKVADDSKPKTPYHTSASRTFSNGSIDGRSIAEEMVDDGRQGRALTNGSRAPET
jgi:la-related protein 1